MHRRASLVGSRQQAAVSSAAPARPASPPTVVARGINDVVRPLHSATRHQHVVQVGPEAGRHEFQPTAGHHIQRAVKLRLLLQRGGRAARLLQRAARVGCRQAAPRVRRRRTGSAGRGLLGCRLGSLAGGGALSSEGRRSHRAAGAGWRLFGRRRRRGTAALLWAGAGPQGAHGHRGRRHRVGIDGVAACKGGAAGPQQVGRRGRHSMHARCLVCRRAPQRRRGSAPPRCFARRGGGGVARIVAEEAARDVRGGSPAASSEGAGEGEGVSGSDGERGSSLGEGEGERSSGDSGGSDWGGERSEGAGAGAADPSGGAAGAVVGGSAGAVGAGPGAGTGLPSPAAQGQRGPQRSG